MSDVNSYRNPYGDFEPFTKSVSWKRSDIESKVAEILVDCLGVDFDEITPDAKLVGDLGAC